MATEHVLFTHLLHPPSTQIVSGYRLALHDAIAAIASLTAPLAAAKWASKDESSLTGKRLFQVPYPQDR